MRISILTALSLAMACSSAWAFRPAPLQAPTLTEKAHFFANSVRGDIPQGEGKFLLNFFYDIETLIKNHEATKGALSDEYKALLRSKFGQLPGCSAFFVANKNHRMLVGSARHCVDFDAKAACAKGLGMKAYATGDIGKCVSVLLDDEDADFFIFEASFDGHPDEYEKVEQLIPAIVIPDGSEEVEAYGFPADEGRHQLPTKTDHCHLFNAFADPEFKKFYAYFLNDESKAASGATTSDASDKFTAGVAALYKNETFLRHNCSIYGGNSGGPMILKGTHYLVGMPETYNPAPQIFPEDEYGLVGTPTHLYTKATVEFANLGIDVETIIHATQTASNGSSSLDMKADDARVSALVNPNSLVQAKKPAPAPKKKKGTRK